MNTTHCPKCGAEQHGRTTKTLGQVFECGSSLKDGTFEQYHPCRLAELEQQNKHLLEALRWAQNEMSHSMDETSCCYKDCQSCKNIQSNPQWKEWWNQGIDPVDEILKEVS